MKFACIGIGAVGGYFAGRLAQAGHDVVFLARGATLDALRTKGLRIESALGDFSLRHVHATDNASTVGAVDTILVAVKAWQVPETAAQIRALVGDSTVVLPLQNGVEAYDQLAAALGAKHVLGGLCHIFAVAAAPAVIRQAGMMPLITLGEWDNSRTPRMHTLLETLRGPGIEVRVPDSIQVALWDKFMYIASLAGVGAVTRAPVGVTRTLPETRSLLQRALQEVIALAHACNIPLPETAAAHALQLLDSLPGESTASMQRDIAANRCSELDSLSGAVVRLAKAHGISAPVHEFIASALLPSEMRARGQLTF